MNCQKFFATNWGNWTLRCEIRPHPQACNYGLHEHVQLMLDSDMNPEAVVAECATKPGCHFELLLLFIMILPTKVVAF